MIIGVIGDGVCPPAVMELAEEVGREIAIAGADLVCGGLGGAMEGACRGAKAEGGRTIGILPGTDRRAANPYVDVPIVTGVDQARNVFVVRTAQVVVAVHGGFGTLSEIAHALKFGIPVVGLNTWELWKQGQEVPAIERASTAKEAVQKAFALAGEEI